MNGLAPRCRLIFSKICSLDSWWECSSHFKVRELGSKRCKSVWSLSVMHILRKLFSQYARTSNKELKRNSVRQLIAVNSKLLPVYQLVCSNSLCKKESTVIPLPMHNEPYCSITLQYQDYVACRAMFQVIQRYLTILGLCVAYSTTVALPRLCGLQSHNLAFLYLLGSNGLYSHLDPYSCVSSTLLHMHA